MRNKLGIIAVALAVVLFSSSLSLAQAPKASGTVGVVEKEVVQIKGADGKTYQVKMVDVMEKNLKTGDMVEYEVVEGKPGKVGKKKIGPVRGVGGGRLAASRCLESRCCGPRARITSPNSVPAALQIDAIQPHLGQDPRVSPTPSTRRPKASERLQRPPLASLAPHQPRAPRNAPHALERGGLDAPLRARGRSPRPSGCRLPRRRAACLFRSAGRDRAGHPPGGYASGRPHSPGW